MIEIRFACNHVLQGSSFDQKPTCACGESRIVSVKAPAPRFSGFVQGPSATFDPTLKAIDVKDRMFPKTD